MKKSLVLAFVVIAVDAIFPDIVTGAEIAVIPAGAVFGAEMLMKLLMPQGPQAPGAPGGGGIDMKPQFDLNAALQQNQTPVPAQDMGFQIPNQTDIGSKMQAAVIKADKPAIVPGAEQAAATAQGLDVVQIPTDAPPEVTGKKSMDDKLQMAAMAAQLGSLLQGPGAPPPPGAPRGGGMSFQPYSPRQLYGG
jgi:hypothetical protein